MNKLIRLSIACSALALLSACGGGGSCSGAASEPLSVNGNTRANSRADQCLSTVVSGTAFDVTTNVCNFIILVVNLDTGGGIELTPGQQFSSNAGAAYAACESPFRPNTPSGNCIG